MGASFADADMTNTLLRLCNLEGCNLKGVRGLDSRQLELARVNAATMLPESRRATDSDKFEILAQTLESLRARAAGDAVPVTDVTSYHEVLDRLDGKGIDTQCARIATSELVSPAAAHTSGQWVDAVLFRRRVSDVLSVLREPSR